MQLSEAKLAWATHLTAGTSAGPPTPLAPRASAHSPRVRASPATASEDERASHLAELHAVQRTLQYELLAADESRRVSMHEAAVERERRLTVEHRLCEEQEACAEDA